MNEVSSPTRKFLKEINAGITSLVLLCVVDRSEEPMYGYQIAKQIDFGSPQGLSMKQSALYPVLRSLEKNEMLASRVEPSISGPPRRYYQITDDGKETLKEWKDIWHHVKGSVDEILEGGNND
jgi:PadR family transcriptional regulator PadR